MIQVKESVLKALLKNESSEKILLNSFNIFLPNKKNLKEKAPAAATAKCRKTRRTQWRVMPNYAQKHLQ